MFAFDMFTVISTLVFILDLPLAMIMTALDMLFVPLIYVVATTGPELTFPTIVLEQSIEAKVNTTTSNIEASTSTQTQLKAENVQLKERVNVLHEAIQQRIAQLEATIEAQNDEAARRENEQEAMDRVCAFMGSMVQDLQQESYEKTKQITDLEKVIERCKAQAQTWVEEKQGSYEKTQQIIDLEDVVERYKAKAQTWVEEKQMFESEVQNLSGSLSTLTYERNDALQRNAATERILNKMKQELAHANDELKEFMDLCRSMMIAMNDGKVNMTTVPTTSTTSNMLPTPPASPELPCATFEDDFAGVATRRLSQEYDSSIVAASITEAEAPTQKDSTRRLSYGRIVSLARDAFSLNYATSA